MNFTRGVAINSDRSSPFAFVFVFFLLHWTFMSYLHNSMHYCLSLAIICYKDWYFCGYKGAVIRYYLCIYYIGVFPWAT